ncbi:MAG: type II toxin-antitoxin system Phd/YefM family antitoxin [Candidatus Nanopelagicales bacterium]|nr:type II toxin-antitoxin system Phd/YefM family antitoxin [Candidatus Nanopelagicales bacterium]
MQTLPVSSVKAKFNEYARRVAREHDRIALTRNGVADTVLIAAADLDALEETIAVLSEPAAMAALLEARTEREAEIEATTAQEMGELMKRRQASD